MGIDICRFSGDVDEDLLCPICSNVLEEPLQAPACEHAFCASCIEQWLSRNQTCPIDRLVLTCDSLKPVPRILRNLLARLSLCCDNQKHGCPTMVKLESLKPHLLECEFNPKRPVVCEVGCGITIPFDELKDHNCARSLRGELTKIEDQMVTVQAENAETKAKLAEQARQIQVLKDLVRSVCGNNPAVRALADQMEADEVVRWANTLPRARVTRWGGMISTPDTALQTMIKRSLTDSGCPQHIVDDLMENSHERRWPPGLSSLETRQTNRRQYENYVCRRVPGKQAVVVMACDNSHMEQNMFVVQPGLVMIFAHGIEQEAAVTVMNASDVRPGMT